MVLFQEFCIFAIVGLLCDFFLQCLLYCTVLAIDIRRKEKIEPSQLFYHHYRLGTQICLLLIVITFLA